MAELCYSAEVQKALQQRLQETLLDAKVPQAQANWLREQGITTVAAFNDLADDRSQVADKIARPAGLDPANAVACQPLKTAWRAAEAIVKADLDARARGEEPEGDKALNETARKRIDRNWTEHYKIFFPPTWLPSNATLGTIKRHLETRAATTYEIHRVKCLVEREEQLDTILLKLRPPKRTVGHEELTEEQWVMSIWVFLYKHRTLMLAYAMAMAPDWAAADLFKFLDYHEFVICIGDR